MTSQQFAAIAATLLSLVTIPATGELLLLTFGAILPRRHTRYSPTKCAIRRLAVVIPAHDEASSIVRCLQSLSACSHPCEGFSASIVVIADNCSDQTAELSRGAGAMTIVRTDVERQGKGFALKDAFEKLLGEDFDAFLVIDADSVVETNLFTEIVALLDSGAQAVQTRYLALNGGTSIPTRLMSVALMASNVLRPSARDRLGLSAGILGNGFALSRATLLAVPYLASSITEDLEYHFDLVRAGRRVAFADSTTVRAEMPPSAEAAATQRMRWEGGRLRMVKENTLAMGRQVLTGNPRALEPLLDLLTPPLSFHVMILSVIFAVGSDAVRLYAVVALAIATFHVTAAVLVAGGDAADLAALVAAPFYVAWKLALAPGIYRFGRKGVEWIRTQR